MNEHVILIAGLAVGTYAIRFAGYVLGSSLPTSGAWGRAFAALPGCLIASLVAVILVDAGRAEWAAAGVAVLAALVTRNVPLTMLAGIVAVGLFRGLL